MEAMVFFEEAVQAPTWDILFGGIFIGLFLIIAVLAAVSRKSTPRWWIIAAIVASLAVAGMFTEGLTRTILLDVSALAAVALVWDTGTVEARKAARNYLVVMVVALICIGSAFAMTGEGNVQPAAALDKVVIIFVLVGFGLKLALAPFYAWLPAVAKSASPLTTALIVSIVDMASFNELIHLSQTAPWIFQESKVIWLVLALLSMFGGALLALGQKDLKAMLAFSTVDDMGYLVLGLLAGTGIGWTGAVIGALSHAFFKVVLFGAVSVAESKLGRSLTLLDRGLASRFPVAGAAFIVGALGMVGVPPTIGFIGRWRLYLCGVEFGGWPFVLAMAAATGLALLYYVQAIHRVWLGTPDGDSQGGEPAAAKAALIVMIVLSVALGLFPGLWTALI